MNNGVTTKTLSPPITTLINRYQLPIPFATITPTQNTITTLYEYKPVPRPIPLEQLHALNKHSLVIPKKVWFRLMRLKINRRNWKEKREKVKFRRGRRRRKLKAPKLTKNLPSLAVINARSLCN